MAEGNREPMVCDEKELEEEEVVVAEEVVADAAAARKHTASGGPQPTGGEPQPVETKGMTHMIEEILRRILEKVEETINVRMDEMTRKIPSSSIFLDKVEETINERDKKSGKNEFLSSSLKNEEEEAPPRKKPRRKQHVRESMV